MQTNAPQAEKPRALVFWRLFALLYDAFPVIALWFLASLAFTLAYTYVGHHDTHQNMNPRDPRLSPLPPMAAPGNP